MEQDTVNNLAYRWLTGDIAVDHSTMGYSLIRFRKEIVALFRITKRFAKERLRRVRKSDRSAGTTSARTLRSLPTGM
jgi:hypothetical protein